MCPCQTQTTDPLPSRQSRNCEATAVSTASNKLAVRFLHVEDICLLSISGSRHRQGVSAVGSDDRIGNSLHHLIQVIHPTLHRSGSVKLMKNSYEEIVFGSVNITWVLPTDLFNFEYHERCDYCHYLPSF